MMKEENVDGREQEEEKEEKQKAKRILLLRIGAILTIGLAIILLLFRNQPFSSFGIGIVIVTGLCLVYGVLAKYLTHNVDRRAWQGNPYHNFFFRGTAALTLVLTLLGVIGAFFVYVEHDNLFQAVGLVTAIIWIGAFLMYFMWAVYHYNINYGLTDEDWDKIYKAERRFKLGLPVREAELEAPKNNPYRSQTFGLPPGTVRGMIAFTLLIGGMSLLIVSFGTEYTGAELALVRQQFEFFETAFLMMIAFYFGDKSLRYLKDRWVDPNRGAGDRNSPSTRRTAEKVRPVGDLDYPDEPRDQVYRENKELSREEFEYALAQDVPPPSTTTLSPKTNASPTSFAGSLPDIEFVQIRDNIQEKVLSDEFIKDTLEELRTKEDISLSLPVVKAIISVESNGRGHLPDGRPKILFEGHKFWYWLEKAKKDPKALQTEFPHILYEKWTKRYYFGGASEYQRLEAAKKIDPKAAIYSTSWGLFQILGENLEHHIKGRNYKDFNDFEEKQHESEEIHFLDFLEFIKSKKVRGKALIHYVSEVNSGDYDWEAFAYGYNGSGYKANQYDVKLKAAYLKFKKETVQAATGWIPIIDVGHGGLVEGNYLTPGKQYRFTDGTVIYEGVINRGIGRQLAEMLKGAGIPYFQTTLETEADIGLMERVNIANNLFQSNPNCYLLSIHSNSSSDSSEGAGNRASGFEVYTSIGLTKSDELANIASKWYKRLFPEYPFRESKTEGGEYKNKEAALKVLTKTRCPAFLVENLFYDNIDEAKFLLSQEGQKRIASCLFEIVREIHRTVRL
jgi:N-acetylmuramoyl-L-alanine amidase